MYKKIGVILADTQEFAPFVNYFSSYRMQKTTVGGNEATRFVIEQNEKEIEIIAVHCGIGKVNAANAAAALIYSCGVDAILNAGLSGAVSTVKRGDIVAGTKYIECDFDMRAIGYPLAVKPDEDEFVRFCNEDLLSIALSLDEYNIKPGILGTGDIFLTDSAKKAEFKELFSVTAFDMETAAIATVCSKNNTDFLSIRKISDDADDSSVEDYREMNNMQEAVLSEIVLATVKKVIEKLS